MRGSSSTPLTTGPTSPSAAGATRNLLRRCCLPMPQPLTTSSTMPESTRTATSPVRCGAASWYSQPATTRWTMTTPPATSASSRSGRSVPTARQPTIPTTVLGWTYARQAETRAPAAIPEECSARSTAVSTATCRALQWPARTYPDSQPSCFPSRDRRVSPPTISSTSS